MVVYKKNASFSEEMGSQLFSELIPAKFNTSHASAGKKKHDHGCWYTNVFKEPLLKEFDPQDQNVR